MRFAPLSGVAKGNHGAGEIASLGKDGAEVEGAVCVASLVGAPVGGQRSIDVSVLLEKDPEVGRGTRVTALVGTRECGDSTGRIAALREDGA